MVFVDTDIDIDIFHTEFGVLGYTVHVTGCLGITGAAGIGHVVLVPQRQGCIDFGHEGTKIFGVEVVYRSQRIIFGFEVSYRQTAYGEYTPVGQ